MRLNTASSPDTLSFQSPDKSQNEKLNESNLSHNISAVKQFLNIVSPNRYDKSYNNSSLLSALFLGGNQSRMERS